MKKHIAICLGAVLVLAGCGTVSRSVPVTVRYSDGIYARPQTNKAYAAASQEQIDNLIYESQGAGGYAVEEPADTLSDPETVQFRTREVTVYNVYTPWYLSGYPYYYGGDYSPCIVI